MIENKRIRPKNTESNESKTPVKGSRNEEKNIKSVRFDADLTVKKSLSSPKQEPAQKIETKRKPRTKAHRVHSSPSDSTKKITTREKNKSRKATLRTSSKKESKPARQSKYESLLADQKELKLIQSTMQEAQNEMGLAPKFSSDVSNRIYGAVKIHLDIYAGADTPPELKEKLFRSLLETIRADLVVLDSLNESSSEMHQILIDIKKAMSTSSPERRKKRSDQALQNLSNLLKPPKLRYQNKDLQTIHLAAVKSFEAAMAENIGYADAFGIIDTFAIEMGYFTRGLEKHEECKNLYQKALVKLQAASLKKNDTERRTDLTSAFNGFIEVLNDIEDFINISTKSKPEKEHTKLAIIELTNTRKNIISDIKGNNADLIDYNAIDQRLRPKLEELKGEIPYQIYSLVIDKLTLAKKDSDFFKQKNAKDAADAYVKMLDSIIDTLA